MIRGTTLAVIFSVGLIFAQAALAQGPAEESEAQETPEEYPSLGSPAQVDNQLRRDAAPKQPLVRLTFLDPYLEFKARLKERTGLGFGIDYSALYLGATESPREDEASGGVARFYGSWELVGRKSGNPGAFVFRIEQRHRYSTIAPSALSFNIGYTGIIAAPFSNQQFRVSNLYWRQTLAQRRVVLFAGFLQSTDFVDAYPLVSPLLHFTNLAFGTGSAAIALPNDGMLGLAGAVRLTDHWYTIASLGDNGADPTDVFTGFDRFVNVKEYFKSVELGWTRGSLWHVDNAHLTLWHTDEQSERGIPSGRGLNFSANYIIANRWMPILRGGYTEDGGSLLQKSISVGLGHSRFVGRSLLAFGANWGEPNETTWGPGLKDQYTFELFWRLFLGAQLALTPDIQLLIDPALNPDQSSIWVFGLRARLAL